MNGSKTHECFAAPSPANHRRVAEKSYPLWTPTFFSRFSETPFDSWYTLQFRRGHCPSLLLATSRPLSRPHEFLSLAINIYPPWFKLEIYTLVLSRIPAYRKKLKIVPRSLVTHNQSGHYTWHAYILIFVQFQNTFLMCNIENKLVFLIGKCTMFSIIYFNFWLYFYFCIDFMWDILEQVQSHAYMQPSIHALSKLNRSFSLSCGYLFYRYCTVLYQWLQLSFLYTCSRAKSGQWLITVTVLSIARQSVPLHSTKGPIKGPNKIFYVYLFFGPVLTQYSARLARAINIPIARGLQTSLQSVLTPNSPSSAPVVKPLSGHSHVAFTR